MRVCVCVTTKGQRSEREIGYCCRGFSGNRYAKSWRSTEPSQRSTPSPLRSPPLFLPMIPRDAQTHLSDINQRRAFEFPHCHTTSTRELRRRRRRITPLASAHDFDAPNESDIEINSIHLDIRTTIRVFQNLDIDLFILFMLTPVI